MCVVFGLSYFSEYHTMYLHFTLENKLYPVGHRVFLRGGRFGVLFSIWVRRMSLICRRFDYCGRQFSASWVLLGWSLTEIWRARPGIIPRSRSTAVLHKSRFRESWSVVRWDNRVWLWESLQKRPVARLSPLRTTAQILLIAAFDLLRNVLLELTGWRDFEH